jgi:hypothetical protein
MKMKTWISCEDEWNKDDIVGFYGDFGAKEINENQN